MMPFFPLRKIKRSGKYLFLGAVLVVVGVAAYLEYVATNTWNNVGKLKTTRARSEPRLTGYFSGYRSFIFSTSRFSTRQKVEKAHSKSVIKKNKNDTARMCE